ncbi:unnamed protein product [Ectocarpus sp. CCAP 1310/34]|nr:unnamed protein product [Ectocarpus sp. CCAP 1310/34]
MAAAATAGESDARAAGRSHPEAEMIAAARGSDGTPVKLFVTDVYHRSSKVFSLETTITIGDLKRLLQEAFVSRPAPQQQRLIFRGKQCKEETQQLGHIMRGLDLSGQHNMHLIVSQPVEQELPAGGSTADVARTPTAQQSSLPQQRPQQQPPLQTPSLRSSSASPAAPHDTAAAAAAAAAASSNERPECVQLSQTQLEQLQRQYEQALRENEKALEEHRQRFNFLSAQSRALTQQRQYRHRTPTATYSSPAPPSQQQQQQQQQQYTEVSARAATRALGGNMPGPAGGGGVRDVTGAPPEGHIPAAGLGQEGEVWRGNLVDPAPNAPDIGREARSWLKMVFQCMGVILVFGIDADGWVLALLALGGLFAFLFRTGLLKEILGSGREGGGLWKKLCTGATVITEGGGILLDARYFFSAFFFSLFPKWQPVRSPEAIAVQAATQAATQAAAQAATQVAAQAQAETQAAAQAQAEAQAEALVAAVRVQAEQTLREAVAATAAAAAATTPAADHGAEEPNGAVEDAVPATDAVAVTSEATDASPSAVPESEVDPATLD